MRHLQEIIPLWNVKMKNAQHPVFVCFISWENLILIFIIWIYFFYIYENFNIGRSVYFRFIWKLNRNQEEKRNISKIPVRIHFLEISFRSPLHSTILWFEFFLCETIAKFLINCVNGAAPFMEHNCCICRTYGWFRARITFNIRNKK